MRQSAVPGTTRPWDDVSFRGHRALCIQAKCDETHDMAVAPHRWAAAIAARGRQRVTIRARRGRSWPCLGRLRRPTSCPLRLFTTIIPSFYLSVPTVVPCLARVFTASRLRTNNRPCKLAPPRCTLPRGTPCTSRCFLRATRLESWTRTHTSSTATEEHTSARGSPPIVARYV